MYKFANQEKAKLKVVLLIFFNRQLPITRPSKGLPNAMVFKCEMCIRRRNIKVESRKMTIDKKKKTGI